MILGSSLGVRLAHTLTQTAGAAALFCTTLQLDPTWVLRVKDGDTFVLRNAGITNVEDVRVCCVDTPEKKAPGFDDATAFTDRWLHAGPFALTVCKRDSFGRLLGTVTRGGEDLATALLEAGLAVPYTRKK